MARPPADNVGMLARATDVRSQPGHSVFEGVEPAVVADLEKSGLMLVAAPGQVLYREGEGAPPFIVLIRGSMRAYCSSQEGAEVTVELVNAPAMFGEAECSLGVPAKTTVVAVERSIVLSLPREAVLRALRASPRLGANLLLAVAQKLSRAIEHQRTMAFDPVDVRLATLLLQYVDLYGVPVYEGTKIRVPLSQDELARVLGVARRSITRALTGWRERGTLLKQAGCFIVSNRAVLEAVAGRRSDERRYASREACTSLANARAAVSSR